MAKGNLGFGLMRLPHKRWGIDVKQTSQMVDAFLDAGFTYFDTAFVYEGSEAATKKALVKRHPRESYTLATKLYALPTADENTLKKELDTSLKRLGTDYVDYYLLHALKEDNYKKFDTYHLWDYAKEEKAKGRIRQYGFSFHGGSDLLEQLLTEHPDVDFVQLQLNYADWENPKIQSRENYEIARRHGKQIVVMEPVKGGKLADPPKEVKQLFDEINPEASYASWAIRFVAGLDGVLSVLSGMSNLEQMMDNLSFMKDFQPLNEQEMEAIRKAQKIFGETKEIPCTSCHYCTDGCPKQIAIPDIFTIMNRRITDGTLERSKEEYAKLVLGGSRASDCISCGQCEKACPQHIEIISELQKCEEALR